MRAGKLYRKIILQTISQTSDGMGGFHKSVTSELVLSAELNDRAGKEILTAGKESTEKVVEFTVRYAPEIKPDMQVNYDGNTYRIEDVVEIGRKKGLKLVCKAYLDG